ncbi:MAG: cytochrome c oxidase subunit I [Acidobacteriaceae bacterium]|nr:cytochrome c oxidase subunit I [Acidobacteriaceae bacterium]MBV8571369.1 cytochrome c oxidase subunit I [Acidobacteriaceae bacterium]
MIEAVPVEVEKNYLTEKQGVLSWFLTTDHKRIAILYTVAVTALFFLGGFFALMMRLELLSPRNWLVSAETYNKLFTMHGIIMVWFFLIPSIPNTLGNFVMPMALGAKDLAFPKLNLLSWYVFMFAAAVTVYALFRGGVDTGWTFYTPFSTSYSTTYVVAAAVGIFISGFSSILTGLNFIATTHKMRAPGLTWYRLPIFVWSMYATSLILVLATPVLAITLLMVAVERIFQVGIFDPALGGDPVLFQHMFWFYSHPAVYIMVLPAMAVVSEIIPAFARKPLFGYKAVAWSSIAIATLGFLVWGHHMFTAGTSVYSAMVFSFLSYCIAVPSAIKVFNWAATIYKGSISWDTPMLYAIGFVGLFTIGGMTGLFLAALGFDVHVQDTYFVVAHFHYIMVGGTVMAFLGGVHYWWPKISGKMYPEGLARVCAIVVFLGFNLTFFPQFVLGYLGMPRRYAAYPEEFQFLHILSTAGATILGVGYVAPLLYLLWAWKYAKPATSNPWRATGLEWKTPSPPPAHNFESTPVVNTRPYDYEAMKEELDLV